MTLQFDAEDNGFCRVYYRDGRKLYCWQDESAWGRQRWEYYVCSRDGEPSHHATVPGFTPLPPGETAVGRDLIAYLSTWQKENQS